ncbi:MAG: hypothetical protein QGH20_11700, partial [Candidatus Latescibacteria bacterium]|nr:hypothetical protein [Candidatus Latescibacterota bacterium]
MNRTRACLKIILVSTSILILSACQSATNPGTTPDPTDPTDETDPTDTTDPTDETDPTDTTDPTDETDPSDTTDPENIECEEAGGSLDWLGDGYCDSENNIDVCSWDAGDCCESTCVSTEEASCGENGYDCRDPSADDYVDPSENPCLAAGGSLNWVSDGYCDGGNNIDACSWDGGDCCESTCVSTDDTNCGVNDYDCRDPDAEDFVDPSSNPCTAAGGQS